MKTVVSLHGNWHVDVNGRTYAFPVPGCLETVVDQRDIAVPVHIYRTFSAEACKGETASLYFGGVSYFCRVVLNGVEICEHEGIWDNFWVDVTGCLQAENLLELWVIKPGYKPGDPYPLREVLSGFVPDVICTFCGPWDDVALVCSRGPVLRALTVDGSMDGVYTARLRVYAPCDTLEAVLSPTLSLDGNTVSSYIQSYALSQGDNTLTLRGTVSNPTLWDTENPVLYTVVANLSASGEEDSISKEFGFRTVSHEGSRILLNGRPVYPRGILHWGYYDEAIIPNPSREQIRREIAQCKALGFTMVKHCLYIPREAYFEEMDRAGMLSWIELPLWLPEGNRFNEHIRREYPRILDQIAGHPSTLFVSLGCELDDTIGSDILCDMYHLAKERTGALVRDNSGSGECYGGLRVDYADFYDYHFYADLHNMEPLMEAFTPGWRGYRPWVFGEFCDIDTLRDLAHVRKAKGVERLWWEAADPVTNPVYTLKPDFYAEHHEERMESAGIRAQWDTLSRLSFAHAMAHRKVTLEQTRSFPEIGGYNITVIRDTPIATSGVFDDMENPKATPEEYLPFNGETVLCPAWDLSRVWICADRVKNSERYNFFSKGRFALTVLCSHYGQADLEAGQLHWRLTRNGKTALSGSVSCDKTIASGQVVEAGYLVFTLPEVTAPEDYVLEVSLDAVDRAVENRWPVFVYPDPVRQTARIGLYDPLNLFAGLDKAYAVTRLPDEQEPRDVDMVFTSHLTPTLCRYLETGGSVFLLQRGPGTLPSQTVCFWRESFFENRPHPLTDGLGEGYLPALRYFSLGTDSALEIEAVKQWGATDYRPILRRYDSRTWLIHDYMAEMTVGRGRLIACTLRLEGGMGKQPSGMADNPLSRLLLDRACDYLMGR